MQLCLFYYSESHISVPILSLSFPRSYLDGEILSWSLMGVKGLTPLTEADIYNDSGKDGRWKNFNLNPERGNKRGWERGGDFYRDDNDIDNEDDNY